MDTQPPEAMTQQTDADLLDDFRRGDRSAFGVLARRWEGTVLRIGFRVTGDLTEAEEVRQAVFLRMLESDKGLRRPDRFSAWIRRAAVNEAISAVRRRDRRRSAAARSGRCSERYDTLSPGAALEARDDSARLTRALGRLEPDTRALLALRFDEGLTFQEASDALGLPISTVKSRTQRAIERLRALLGGGEP